MNQNDQFQFQAGFKVFLWFPIVFIIEIPTRTTIHYCNWNSPPVLSVFRHFVFSLNRLPYHAKMAPEVVNSER